MNMPLLVLLDLPEGPEADEPPLNDIRFVALHS
jgi:hypothetical protein